MDRLTEANLASLRASHEPRPASHQRPRIDSYLASLAQSVASEASEHRQASHAAVPDLAHPGPLSARRTSSVTSARSAQPSRDHSATASKRQTGPPKQAQPAASRKRTKRRPLKEQYSSDADPEQRNRLDQRKQRRADLKSMRSGPRDVFTSREALPHLHKAKKKAKAGERRKSSVDGQHEGKNQDVPVGRPEQVAEVRRRKLANVNKDRITLTQRPSLGVFNKGAASSRIQSRQNQGVPDLAFNEYSFLSRPAAANPIFLPVSKADMASKVRDDGSEKTQSVDACSARHSDHEGHSELPQACRHQAQEAISHSKPTTTARVVYAPEESAKDHGKLGRGSASQADSDLSEAHSAYSLLQRRQRAAVEEARLHAQAAPIGRAAVGTAPIRPRPAPSLLSSQMQSQTRSGQSPFHHSSVGKQADHSSDFRGSEQDRAGSPLLDDTKEVQSFVWRARDDSARPAFLGEDWTASPIWQEGRSQSGEPGHQAFRSPSAPRAAKAYPLHSVEVGHDEVCMDGWSELLTSQNKTSQNDEDEPFKHEVQKSSHDPGLRFRDHDTGADLYRSQDWASADTGRTYVDDLAEEDFFPVCLGADGAAALGRPSHEAQGVNPVRPATAPVTPKEPVFTYSVSKLSVMRELARPEEDMPRTRLSTFVAAEMAERRERPHRVELYKEDKDFKRFWL